MKSGKGREGKILDVIKIFQFFWLSKLHVNFDGSIFISDSCGNLFYSYSFESEWIGNDDPYVVNSSRKKLVV